MAAIKYIILFAICFPSFGQGQGVDGGGGPPRTSLSRFLDANGNWQSIEDLNHLIKRKHDYKDLLRNMGRSSELDIPSDCENPGFNFCDSRVLQGVLDINTRDHGIIDTETLRDLKPEWMIESGGEIWVDPRAPITDYQTSDGEIKPF
ncbi:MAG: hypothetical protein K9K67_00605 [Bacteriovoracaceae bacterium]|nr:hypothetical protein [Bacteriovoracaceae bacterium]